MRTALVLFTTTLIATASVDDGAKSAENTPRCIDVEVEGRHSLNCLNDKLRVDAPKIAAPLDSRSPDVRIGIVNMPAVQQQFGRNYGVSVVPYRPVRP
jgi:hypothetical protein